MCQYHLRLDCNIHRSQSIATNHVRRRILNLWFKLPPLLSSLGGSLGPEVEVLLTTFFQSLPVVARIINDYHCIDPQVQLSVLGQNQNQTSQKNMPRTVYLRPAVIRVPIVIGTGLLQKKGLIPAPCLREIKHVKVFLLSLLVFLALFQVSPML